MRKSLENYLNWQPQYRQKFSRGKHLLERMNNFISSPVISFMEALIKIDKFVSE